MTTWTTGKVLAWAAADFRKRGLSTPRLDAELLLADLLGCRRIDLYIDFERPLSESEQRAFRESIARRRKREPVAYITGKKEFWSLEFAVDPRVLVPRPETETLVEVALKRLPDGAKLLDLCTGSGCVALAIAATRPDCFVDAADISEDACAVARENAERHGLSDRVSVYAGDLFAPLPEGRRYDGITANPPYVPESDIESLPAEVRKEPRVAFLAGRDGLELIRRVLKEAPLRLVPGGWLFVEIDPRQSTELAYQIGPSLLGVKGEIFPDLSGLPRVVAFHAVAL